MFDNLPNLESSSTDKLHRLVVMPFWFLGLLIQGDTCLWIDASGNLHFKPFQRVTLENGEEGIIVDGEYRPADGPQTFMQRFNVTLVVAFEDIRTLLNPSALQVDEDVLADGGTAEVASPVEIVTTGSSRSVRALLAWPFWFSAVLLQPSTCIEVDDDGYVKFQKGREVSEPEDALVVNDQVKRAEGPGCFFQRWGARFSFSRKGEEALWNPATAEILRAKDQVEAETDATIGAGEDEKQGVYARVSTAVSPARLADYVPFAMMDGTMSRKQMNTAYEARSKYKDGSTLGKIIAILTAFMLGAMSPRFNGTAGGGGGSSGGFSLPIGYLAPNPDHFVQLQGVLDVVATAGVV
jgi:hypothetical protein